jgi:S1-C subfamily serine protease
VAGSPAPAPKIGDIIGGFTLRSQLGEGGMGVVWLAEEEAGEQRRAALKVLPEDLSHNEEIRERFLRETRYAEHVRHPNIAEVYGAGEENGNLWLAMRYLEGTDLAAVIRRGGPLQPRRAMAITGQVAAALDEAHQAGLLHRDIKPANIMLASSNGGDQAFVIDFGLGKAPQTDEQGLTKPGQFVGTIDYTAPEQITQQQTLDGKVDQYSLACVLYEMLTGEVPFPKKRDVEVIMAHVGEPPPKPSEKREGLPAAIDDVIAKAMAKDPGERYPTCTAFFEAASEALAPVLDKELAAAEGAEAPAGADTVYLMFESGDEKGRVVQVTGDEFVIGRDDQTDLQILDTRASRRHATLKVLPGGNAELRDLDSSNGTLLNGAPVKSAVLSGSERIRIGDTEFSFYPVDPVRAKTMIGLTDKPRLSQIIAKRGQSAIQRLRLEKRLRQVTIAVGSLVVVVLVLVVLLVAGVFSGGGPNISAVVNALGPATVFVKADSGATGSGWVLDSGEGLIVTNAHVVNQGSSYQVGAGGKLVPAAVVGVAPCEDLAVLRINPVPGLKTMPLGSQSSVKEGDDVVALGYPQSASANAQLTATAGVVSVARTQYNEQTPDIPLYSNVIQTDTALNPGNSGGPLVSTDKKLIGVNSAVRTENGQGRAIQGQNYAIGVDRVKQVANYLRTGRSLGWVGFRLAYPEDKFLAENNLSPGVTSGSAVAGSPAAKSNGVGGKTLLIIGVNGKRTSNSLAGYCSAAANIQAGQTADFTVQDITDPSHAGKPTVLKLKVP